MRCAKCCETADDGFTLSVPRTAGVFTLWLQALNKGRSTAAKLAVVVFLYLRNAFLPFKLRHNKTFPLFYGESLLIICSKGF